MYTITGNGRFFILLSESASFFQYYAEVEEW